MRKMELIDPPGPFAGVKACQDFLESLERHPPEDPQQRAEALKEAREDLETARQVEATEKERAARKA